MNIGMTCQWEPYGWFIPVVWSSDPIALPLACHCHLINWQRLSKFALEYGLDLVSCWLTFGGRTEDGFPFPMNDRDGVVLRIKTSQVRLAGFTHFMVGPRVGRCYLTVSATTCGTV